MKLSPRRTLFYFWQEVCNYKLLTIAVFGTSIIAYVIEVIMPLYVKKFFDLLTTTSFQNSKTQQLLLSAWMMILVWSLLRWFFYRISGMLNTYFQPRIMLNLEQHAFEYLLHHSYRFYSNSFAGSLARRISRFGRSFETIADQILWEILKAAILVGGTLYIFYLRQPWLAAILGVWVLIFVIANILFSMWKLPYDEKRASFDSEQSGKISDALSNSLTIMQFTGHTHERSIMREMNERLRAMYTFTWRLGELNTAVQVLLMIVLEYFIIATAIKYYVAGQLTLGDFALIQSALASIFGVLWGFGRTMRHLYEAFADAREMVEILDEPHEIQDVVGAKKLLVSNGIINFEKVFFGYGDDHSIIKKMTFETKAQEKIALVGSSGAGKTTVIKLLLRFFDIRSGSILIDGQNIAEVTQKSLRDTVSLVPQDPILFHRSIMENIRYGRRDATNAEVFAAAKKAHCHEFITELANGYDTLVGERGVKLSGGERQRVAIARAILKDAPILILDEATSSLDSESEAFIQDALHELMHKKTVIVIAHRLSTIMQMDRILVIEEGKVVDEGTHAQLFKRKGRYSRLWKIQAGSFKK